MTLREEILNLSEPNYNLDTLRQKYILKIHNEFINLLDCDEEPSAETIAKRAVAIASALFYALK